MKLQTIKETEQVASENGTNLAHLFSLSTKNIDREKEREGTSFYRPVCNLLQVAERYKDVGTLH